MAVQNEHGLPGQGLRRVLGPVDATCVVIGAIIGVGIFFTPSRVAQLAGSGELAMLAWAIARGMQLPDRGPGILVHRFLRKL